MLRIVQKDISGFNLLRGDAWRDIVQLIQQRGDLTCLRANVDVVKAQTKEPPVSVLSQHYFL